MASPAALLLRPLLLRYGLAALLGIVLISGCAAPTPTPTATPVPASPDRAALVAFYHATGGSNWRPFGSRWLEDGPLILWSGVATDGAGRVTELRLDWNRLSGEIPAELGSLANLERLSLESNDLRGRIPPELGNLASLEYLLLGSNRLTGEIPPELGSLPKLEVLSLEYNRLSGEIPPELPDLPTCKPWSCRPTG